MAEKNNFIPKTNDILKFVLNIVAAVIIIAGIVLWPMRAKIQIMEEDLDYIKKEHKEHCKYSDDKLVSKEALSLHLKPVEQSIEALKLKIEAFQLKNESFQRQLFEILRHGPS